MTPVLKDLHWLKIKPRIEFKILTLVFKAINQLAPVYLTELLTMYVPGRSLRSSSHVNVLVEPKWRIDDYADQNFHITAPRFWNQLPTNLRNIPTLDVFKRNLKTHLFRLNYAVGDITLSSVLGCD